MIGVQTIQRSFIRLFSARTEDAQATDTTRKRPAIPIAIDQAAGEGGTAVMRVRGRMDQHCYKQLLAAWETLHAAGTERLVLDLRGVTKVELTGFYALHCLARIFRDEAYADPDHGMAGLRRMAEENLAAGTHERVRLRVDDAQSMAALKKAGLDRVFPITVDSGA